MNSPSLCAKRKTKEDDEYFAKEPTCFFVSQNPVGPVFCLFISSKFV